LVLKGLTVLIRRKYITLAVEGRTCLPFQKGKLALKLQLISFDKNM